MEKLILTFEDYEAAALLDGHHVVDCIVPADPTQVATYNTDLTDFVVHYPIQEFNGTYFAVLKEISGAAK